MSEKKEKIPLQSMLMAMDTNNIHFYDKLTPGQKKEFSPWLAMRFSSSASGRHAEHCLLMTNDFVNSDFGSLYTHPELQWQLLAVCGVGTKQHHPFLRPGKKKGKNKIQAELSKLYSWMRSDELALMEHVNSKDELKELFASAGHSNKEIKEILK